MVFNPTRRQFIKKALTLGGGLASLGGMGWLWGSQEPPPAQVNQNIVEKIFDFYPGQALLVKSHGTDRAELLKACLQKLGGMEKFIQPGQSVLLKVNAAFASPPNIGATTHPDLLKATIDLCRQAGAARIVVSDHPVSDPATCFTISGIRQVCLDHKVELIEPRSEFFTTVSLPGGRLIKNWPVMLKPLENIDKVIGLCPVKSHVRSQASLSIKNWYGLLGGRRGIFHQQIDQIIFELAQLVRPTLLILDGVYSMVTNGPTGGSPEDLKPTNTLLVGTDPVAIDAWGARLLGLNPENIGYLKLCQAAGLGKINFSELQEVYL